MSKVEIIERLYNAGQITFAEALTLAGTEEVVKLAPYTPPPIYPPIVPLPYIIQHQTTPAPTIRPNPFRGWEITCTSKQKV